MELILIRHARPYRVDESDGLPDPGLDDLGLEQARILAETLADEPITAVYASTLRRARETAEPLAARLGLDIRAEPDLVELTLGETQYVPFGQGKRSAKDQEAAAGWLARLREPEGVAAVARFRARVSGRLAAIAAQHPEESIAVACHGGVITAYLTDVLGIDEAMTFSFQYAGISRVLVSSDGRRRVRSVNEHLHLRGHAG